MSAHDPGSTRMTEDAEAFNRILGELRPKLHRYCARMTGSVVDGEDVVQDALVKAMEGFAQVAPVANLEGWLFRIAHNAALDFLRRRARREALHVDEDPDTMSDPLNRIDERQVAAASLRTFMGLPVAQRSSIILMDVLGYSLQEIGDVTASSIAAVKAALHRGRARLRELAQEPEDRSLPSLTEQEGRRLAAYAAHFNARDFDAIRDMLADDVRLDLVSHRLSRGRTEVGRYFHNYAQIEDWHFVAGFVDGRPAMLVHDPRNPSDTPAYFVLLEWTGDELAKIRDFRYARYATDGADYSMLRDAARNPTGEPQTSGQR
jgi:RNA polymerase sigma-70 factor, ECF subfamily